MGVACKPMRMLITDNIVKSITSVHTETDRSNDNKNVLSLQLF